MLFCAKCEKKGCAAGKPEDFPQVCPSKNKEIKEKALKLYEEEENHKIAYNSAMVEFEGYCQKTRVEETIMFMKRCGYKKIGIAFCVGLKNEAKKLVEILENHGFEVCSAICKNGAIPKGNFGIKDNQTLSGNANEVACNPIGQALLLNEEGVDFTILFGLCVGHDTLAIKYLDSPVTALVVKDRVLCHNPIAAIYQADAYYKKKLAPDKK